MTTYTKYTYTDDDNRLLYEGDVFNKKYHGKGKLYFPNGNLEYEGEFINNKFHGNGKLYYFDGNLRYEGEFINNKAHGNGKVYNNKGTLIFIGIFQNHTWYEGELLDYKPHGKGKLYFVDMHYAGFKCYYNVDSLHFRNIGLHYDGMFEEGKYNGYGILYIMDWDYIFNDGNIYAIINENIDNRLIKFEGLFKDNNYVNGKIYTYIYDNNEFKPSKNILLYEGCFENNQATGEGTLYYEDFIDSMNEYLLDVDDLGDDDNYIIKGKFKNNCVNGRVKMFYDIDNIFYDGEFSNNKFHGEGILYKKNGELIYSGIFQNDKYYIGEILNHQYNGYGKIYNRGVLEYEGEFINSKYHGLGKRYNHFTNNIAYEGEFINSKYHGLGKRYNHFTNNIAYEGEFVNGLQHGHGKLYKNETLEYEGEFKNNKFIENLKIIKLKNKNLHLARYAPL